MKIMDDKVDQMIDIIEANRNSKLKAWTETKQRLRSGDIMMAHEALEYGLIDEIGTLPNIVSKDYPNVRVKFMELSGKQKFEMYRSGAFIEDIQPELSIEESFVDFMINNRVMFHQTI